jgi:NADH:ubiquinone oxidoreductase subunit 6 (subunit J)
MPTGIAPAYREREEGVMLLAVLAAVGVLCGIQAIRARGLIIVAVWLAVVSACTAGLLYAAGAFEIAVIELSVGIGLVTVLFVFAITAAGGPAGVAVPVVPVPLAGALIAISLVLLSVMLIPMVGEGGAPAAPLAQTLWQDRGLDVLAQAVLIFTGVLGVLGLLSGEARR